MLRARRQLRCSLPWAHQLRAQQRQRRAAQRQARPRTMSRESVMHQSGVQFTQEIRAYQIVSQKLHDESGVLVALLRQGVKLCAYISLAYTTV
jgi:hypothetical protein